MTATTPEAPAPPPAAIDKRTQLRTLLTAYSDALRSVTPSRPAWLQSVPRRFLTGRIRSSIDELERTLHAEHASTSAAETKALLDDLAHFRQSLRPALASFQRTLIVVAVVLVAQLLGRVPSIPIVDGARRTPATGSLNEALDLDPGHVAKTIADLVGSPAATVLGAISTLAAAAFIVLALPAWGSRRARRLFGDPVYARPFPKVHPRLPWRRAKQPAEHPLPALETATFQALGATRPTPPPYDLALLGCVAVGLLTFGLSWYIAYVAGLLRRTSRFDDARLPFHEAFVKTRHPWGLGIGGFALVLAGIAVALLIAYAVWSDRLRRTGDPGPRPKKGRVLRDLVRVYSVLMVVVGVAAVGLLVVFYLPVARQYRDPRLVVRIADAAPRDLARQPVLTVGMLCRPSPCTVTGVSIHLPGPGGLGERAGETIMPVEHPRTLASLQSLGTRDRVHGPRWRDRVQDQLGPEFSVRTAQAVQFTDIDEGALRAARLTVFGHRRHHVPYTVGAADYATALLITRGRSRAHPVFEAYEGAVLGDDPEYGFFGVVLSPADVQRLRRLGRAATSVGTTATLALTVRMHSGTKTAVRIPLVLRGPATGGGI